MKSNKQKKIVVKNSGYKRSKFNWAHDVNTTFSWGEIQPTQCKMLIPGSKTTCQVQNLIRLAPMPSPTFGRVKYKTFNQFVEMADVFPNFDAMMAQEPKSTASGTKIPQEIPSIKLGKLSAYVLMGARATLYYATGSTSAARKANAEAGIYKTQYRTYNGTAPSEITTEINRLISGGVFNVNYGRLPAYCPDTGTTGNHLTFIPSACNSILDSVYALDPATQQAFIVLGADTSTSLIPYDKDDDMALKYMPATTREVSIDSADYVIEFNYTDSSSNTYYYALALECSDYGKRIRKILQGLGYQIDLASTTQVSILPLLAQYKAYFDIFGLTLYNGWETTSCAKLIKIIENDFVTNLDSSFAVLPCTGASSLTSNQKEFGRFMLCELANEFYTEDADFVGANIASLSVSPEADTSKFITVDNANGITTCNNHISEPNSFNTDGTSYTQDLNGTGANTFGYPSVGTQFDHNGAFGIISNALHGQVDAELLKRMYKWVNRNTILGREIAKILRAQGLGKYVDECKSNFIGSSDTMITISDVISQSNTYDSNSEEGALLGQYGGRGLQYDATGTLVFENDVYGYWITLATIVPEAGYTQGLDPTLTSLDKFGMYLPDFDALGMEATPKSTIVGNRYLYGSDNTTVSSVNTEDTFGFIPRMSKFKICQNLVNGDFNRHNMRNAYLPYTLDRQLSVNDFQNIASDYTPVSGSTPAYTTINIKRSMQSEAMPIASNIWRTPTKYSWMGNFDRIFTNVFDNGKGLQNADEWYNNANGTLIGFTTFNEDNFLSHAIYDVQSYAPMKPIEDSYGLDDDEPGVTGVTPTQKA